MIRESIVRMAAVVLCSLLATGAAHAVYRCGNMYQDQPCDDKGPQSHLTPGMKATPAPAAAGTAAAPASPFAAACSRIGQEAKKAVWKREGGATQEKQLAELPNTGSREEMANMLDSVYRKRGSAPEISRAVELECIAEKQKEADTAEAMKLLLQSRQSGKAPAAATAPEAPPVDAGAATLQKTATDKKGPSPSCAGWRGELDTVNADFRKGGNAVRMEELQNRRRDVEQRLRDGRC
jgi:hypothetical protein